MYIMSYDLLLDKALLYLMIIAELFSESHETLDLQPTTSHMESPVNKNDYSPLLQVAKILHFTIAKSKNNVKLFSLIQDFAVKQY